MEIKYFTARSTANLVLVKDNVQVLIEVMFTLYPEKELDSWY